MGGAVFERALQLQHHLAGAVTLEPFVGDRRAGDIAAQVLQLRADRRPSAPPDGGYSRGVWRIGPTWMICLGSPRFANSTLSVPPVARARRGRCTCCGRVSRVHADDAVPFMPSSAS